MRILGICLLLLFITCGLPAQDTSSTSIDRKKQQMFTIKYLEKHDLQNDSVESAPELDRLLDKIESAWASNSESTIPAFQRLDSYTYLMIGGFLNAGDWIDCYIWQKYRVPGFLKDFEYFKSKPTTSKSNLIWPGNVSNTFDGILQCELPENGRAGFYEAYAELPAVIAHYLESGAYASSRQEETLRSLKSRFEKLGSLIRMHRALSEDNLEDAFAELTVGYQSGNVALRYLLKPGKLLAYRFADSGQIDQALSVLDLMARSNIKSELPRDSLRSWYTEISPERGPSRFNKISDFRITVLKETDRTAQLSGKYLLLNSGKEFDLSTLEGETVVIDFWATWCVPCIEEIPRLNRFHETYGKRDEVVFITVNSDSLTSMNGKEHVLNFMEKHNVRHPVILDTREHSLTEKFTVRGFPTKFVINPDGKFLERPVDDTPLTLDAIEEYLQQQF